MNTSKLPGNSSHLSTENLPEIAILEKYVKHIFRRFEELYGHNWSKRLSLEPNVMLRVWAVEIRDLLPDDIRRGLKVCMVRHKTFPPTLPEFLAACAPSDPSLVPQIAFEEAVKNWVRRKARGEWHGWSHPAIYWASVQFGKSSLLQESWRSAQGKWTALLKAEMEKREWPPIPIAELKHSEPKKKPVSKEVGKAHLEKIKILLGSTSPSYKK